MKKRARLVPDCYNASTRTSDEKRKIGRSPRSTTVDPYLRHDASVAFLIASLSFVLSVANIIPDQHQQSPPPCHGSTHKSFLSRSTACSRSLGPVPSAPTLQQGPVNHTRLTTMATAAPHQHRSESPRAARPSSSIFWMLQQFLEMLHLFRLFFLSCWGSFFHILNAVVDSGGPSARPPWELARAPR